MLSRSVYHLCETIASLPMIGQATCANAKRDRAGDRHRRRRVVTTECIEFPRRNGVPKAGWLSQIPFREGFKHVIRMVEAELLNAVRTFLCWYSVSLAGRRNR